jgi:hypothetical protein
MKIKNIYKFLFAAFLALQLSACDNNTDAEPKFDQTPTERLNAQKAELNEVLLSSPEGWKTVYFTDNTVLGGYTHLFKFAANGTVEMASDFDDVTETYKSEVSEYQIQLGSTVSLVFTTKNKIHLLSDSNNYPIDALTSEGYRGDFQFLYYGQENGEIIFRTNRNNQELRFVKATKEDWDDLVLNFDMIPNIIGDPTLGLYRGLEVTNGTTKTTYDFNPFSTVTRHTTITDAAGSYDMGIGYAPNGLVVSPPVVVGNQKLSNFIFNETDGSFTATGTGSVSASIKYSDVPFLLTDDYKILLSGRAYSRFGYYTDDYTVDAPTNSVLFNEEIAKIDASLPAGQYITGVQLYMNHSLGTFIYYTFAGRTALQHFVDVQEDVAGKKIILKHKSWNGNTTAATPAFLASFDSYLMDPNGIYAKKESFKLGYSNTVYTFKSLSSTFRMTTWQLN